jgi:acetoin:2,6-dichlorophenolindophenol oxidoreductase subunit alpha
MPLPRDRILPLLESMLRMRRTEEAICTIGPEFPGNFHVYIGQEATGAVVVSLLRPDDPIFTTHRNHAHNVARGMPAEQILGEILGKATGPSGGKGGTFHVMSKAQETAATAIVGGSTILATGAGLAAQVLGDGRIGVAFLGDRTQDEGAVQEAFNLAGLWQLPVLYVCENNSRDHQARSSNLSAGEIADIARAYRIETATVDATDVTNVFDAAAGAIEWVRSGAGPFFLETRTAVWPGNAGADPSLEATGATDIRRAWQAPADDPHESWHSRDPVLRIVKLAITEEVADQSELLALDQRIKQELEAAIQAARSAPFPEPDRAFEDALAGGARWPR